MITSKTNRSDVPVSYLEVAVIMKVCLWSEIRVSAVLNYGKENMHLLSGFQIRFT